MAYRGTTQPCDDMSKFPHKSHLIDLYLPPTYLCTYILLVLWRSMINRWTPDSRGSVRIFSPKNVDLVLKWMTRFLLVASLIDGPAQDLQVGLSSTGVGKSRSLLYRRGRNLTRRQRRDRCHSFEESEESSAFLSRFCPAPGPRPQETLLSGSRKPWYVPKPPSFIKLAHIWLGPTLLLLYPKCILQVRAQMPPAWRSPHSLSGKVSHFLPKTQNYQIHPILPYSQHTTTITLYDYLHATLPQPSPNATTLTLCCQSPYVTTFILDYPSQLDYHIHLMLSQSPVLLPHIVLPFTHYCNLPVLPQSSYATTFTLCTTVTLYYPSTHFHRHPGLPHSHHTITVILPSLPLGSWALFVLLLYLCPQMTW